MSEQVDQIAAALAEASKKIANPERNRVVRVTTEKGGYTYSYATLDAVLDEVRPKLAEVGIAIVQPVVYRDGKPWLITRLLHSSGQSIEHELPILVDASSRMNSAQAFGSALTYARRYGLETLLPVAAEHDDDGHGAGSGSGGEAVDAPRKAKAPDPAGGIACPQCGGEAKPSQYPKPGKTHYCFGCKHPFEPGGEQ